MAAVSEDRKEYMKRYRENNKEKIKELNHKNYLKRKQNIKKDTKVYNNVLIMLKENKRRRQDDMNATRLKRRKALQQAIYNDLEREESIIV